MESATEKFLCKQCAALGGFYTLSTPEMAGAPPFSTADGKTKNSPRAESGRIPRAGCF